MEYTVAMRCMCIGLGFFLFCFVASLSTFLDIPFLSTSYIDVLTDTITIPNHPHCRALMQAC